MRIRWDGISSCCFSLSVSAPKTEMSNGSRKSFSVNRATIRSDIRIPVHMAANSVVIRFWSVILFS